MGFTTGFLGGLTLTYSLLYLSLYLHRTNRTYQHTLLSQQSVLLNSFFEPAQPSSPRSTASRYNRINPSTLEVEEERWSRQEEESLVETLKERWNSEVEGMVRRVQDTDWSAVRERWERRGVNFWRNVVRE